MVTFEINLKMIYFALKEDGEKIMRVIAGSARRIQLNTPKGNETRPTTDRIKETLFNMLQPRLADCRFLDIFSGSGGIGIEALSRGAKYAVFIENNREAQNCIKDNLKRTKLEEKATVLNSDYMTGLQNLNQKRESFDIIFMDPPYRLDYEKKVLEYLKTSSFIHEESLIIFEAALDTKIDDLEAMGYNIYKIKEYKTNKHIFLTIKS